MSFSASGPWGKVATGGFFMWPLPRRSAASMSLLQMSACETLSSRSAMRRAFVAFSIDSRMYFCHWSQSCLNCSRVLWKISSSMLALRRRSSNCAVLLWMFGKKPLNSAKSMSASQSLSASPMNSPTSWGVNEGSNFLSALYSSMAVISPVPSRSKMLKVRSSIRSVKTSDPNTLPRTNSFSPMLLELFVSNILNVSFTSCALSTK
mmetsp:Transcript_105031/g.321876  ORF Transcript_105031/g.321876 Transcript_105031/m.321876 type:complete len:206 (-) Transcript_105031:1581-2198(-)